MNVNDEIEKTKRRLSWSFALPLALLIAVGVFFSRRTSELLDLSAWVANTEMVRAQIDEQQKLLVDLETGVRGYLLTGKKEFLEPYYLAIDTEKSQLDSLAHLVADNPKEVARTHLLRELSEKWLESAKADLENFERRTYDSSTLEDRKQMMDAIRSVVSEMEQEEDRLLKSRRSEVENRSRSSIRLWLFSLFVLGLGLAFYARKLISSVSGKYENALAERAEASRLLKGANLLLESRVEERTRALSLSQKEFRAVADTASDVIVTMDAVGQIIYINRSGESVFEYDSNELLGRSFSILFPNGVWEIYQSGVRSSTQTGVSWTNSNRVELIALRRNGSEFPIELSTAKWETQEGHFYTSILRDITQRRNAEEGLKLTNSQLDSANKELEAFCYSVSHDLRTPLRGIDGFSQALLEEYDDLLDSTGKRYLSFIREGTQKMGRLIDDLLDLSRLSRAELRIETVNLSSNAREIAERLNTEGSFGNVRFSADADLVVDGDAGLLKVALENLLSNAWKFSAKNKSAEVRFGATENEGKKVYFIQDNGAGFDMAYYGKLFGAFQRLHSSKEFEGTGIGLATARRVVHRHGGSIWAEGELGKGATFYFTL